MGFWLHLQSGDVLSAIEVCATLEHTMSLNISEVCSWNEVLRNTFKVVVCLQFLPCTNKLMNRQIGLIDFGWAWEAVIFSCNLWASLWSAVRGALSHVEQHAFSCLWGGERTLDVVQFFDTETQFFLQTKERILARGFDVVSALCFSPVF